MITNKEKVYLALKQQGWDRSTCIAIMANIEIETGGTYDYTIKQKGGNGYGLFQFDFHKKYYYSFLKQNEKEDSIKSQIEYVSSTIYGENTKIIGQGTAQKIGQILEDKSKSAKYKTQKFCEIWEKPGIPHLDKRLQACTKLEHELK